MAQLGILSKLSAAPMLGRALTGKKRNPYLLGGLGLVGLNIPGVGNFIQNELLGIDDFKRAARYAGEGDFSKMLRSLGAGAFELGSTVIPSGNLLKAARGGEALIKAAPIGSRVVSAIPGLTQAGALTPMGTRALQGFRAAETAQLVDALNSGLNQFTGRGVMLGSAKMNAEKAAEEEFRRRLQQNVLSMMGGYNAL